MQHPARLKLVAEQPTDIIFQARAKSQAACYLSIAQTNTRNVVMALLVLRKHDLKLPGIPGSAFNSRFGNEDLPVDNNV